MYNKIKSFDYIKIVIDRKKSLHYNYKQESIKNN